MSFDKNREMLFLEQTGNPLADAVIKLKVLGIKNAVPRRAEINSQPLMFKLIVPWEIFPLN